MKSKQSFFVQNTTLKKGNSTEEQKILNLIPTRAKDYFPSVKAICDYLLARKRLPEINQLLTKYFTRSNMEVDVNKLTQAICYLIEIGELKAAEALLFPSLPDFKKEITFKLVGYFLERDSLQEAIKTLQEFTYSEDTDVAKLLTGLKPMWDPSSYWDCALAFVKYYVKQKSPDLALAIFRMNKSDSSSLPLFLEIVKFYHKQNQPKMGTAIARAEQRFLDYAYLEEVKYHLEKKNFREADQIAKLIVSESLKIEAAKYLLTYTP